MKIARILGHILNVWFVQDSKKEVKKESVLLKQTSFELFFSRVLDLSQLQNIEHTHIYIYHLYI